ncbi:hypothetical protein DMUE_4368 [Dictyocoela muelleri]|nr:hypothetical protein DMUE_4368 [Dictyocoela muelleri]
MKFEKYKRFNTQKYEILRDYYTKLRKIVTEFPNGLNHELLEVFKYKFDNELILQYDSGSLDEKRIIIFTTEYNLRIINQVKNGYVWHIFRFPERFCTSIYHTLPIIRKIYLNGSYLYEKAECVIL